MIHPKFPHRFLYLLFLGLIAFGLSMGKSLMSIGVIAVSANWILEGKFQQKWNTIKERQYLPLIFLVFFVTHLIWGLLSDDLAISFKDLKMKLPFLALPIVIGSSKKFIRKELIIVLALFIVGLIISTGVGFSKYLTGNYESYRELSVFVSHIRLGLFVGIGIGIIVYLFSITENKLRFLFAIPILYLVFFLQILGSGTGYFAGATTIILSLIFITYSSKKKWIFYTSISLLLIGILATGIKTYSDYKDIMTPREGVYEDAPVYTAQMNLYFHYPEIEIYENGYPVYMNYCPPELEKGWNAVSTIPLDSLDKKGQLIQGTVLRYMTSLGLLKDAEGVTQLTPKDIENIENGISSVVPPNSGFKARLQETLLEYVMFKNHMNPNGHSLVQRLYYLEAAWDIFTNHIVFGVSKSKEEEAYANYYDKTDSLLNEENRLRAHNQFLSFLVCFGIVGTILLMFSLIYPMLKSPFTFISILFILISVIGFLSDDMLNRQAGVTYFAFFYCIIYLSGTNLKVNNIVANTID